MENSLSQFPSEIPRLSPSQLSIWLDCGKMWEWEYVVGIKRRPSSKTFFEKGLYYHQLSHHYYHLMANTGRKAGDGFLLNAMNNRMQQDFKSVTPDNVLILSSVIKMMSRYLAIQSPKIDRGIRNIQAENHLEFLATTPNGLQIVIQGFVDLIYVDNAGRLRIRDHKTGANPTTWTPAALDLELQLLFYAALYWQISSRVPDLVEINYISTAKNPSKDNEFKLLKKAVTPTAIENFWNYLLATVDKMYTDKPTHHYGICSGCQFKQLCELELNGQPTQSAIRAGFISAGRDYSVRPAGAGKETVIVPEVDATSDLDFTLNLS